MWTVWVHTRFPWMPLAQAEESGFACSWPSAPSIPSAGDSRSSSVGPALPEIRGLGCLPDPPSWGSPDHTDYCWAPALVPGFPAQSGGSGQPSQQSGSFLGWGFLALPRTRLALKLVGECGDVLFVGPASALEPWDSLQCLCWLFSWSTLSYIQALVLLCVLYWTKVTHSLFNL